MEKKLIVYNTKQLIREGIINRSKEGKEDREIKKDRRGVIIRKELNEEIMGKNKGLIEKILSKEIDVKERINRFGLISRLDKDTEGIVILGINKEILNRVREELRRKEVLKRYWIYGEGNIKKKFVVKGYIGRLKKRRMIGEEGRGYKYSLTLFRRLIMISRKGLRIFIGKVFPLTGKTNQIKIHVGMIGVKYIKNWRLGLYRLGILKNTWIMEYRYLKGLINLGKEERIKIRL